MGPLQPGRPDSTVSADANPVLAWAVAVVGVIADGVGEAAGASALDRLARAGALHGEHRPTPLPAASHRATPADGALCGNPAAPRPVRAVPARPSAVPPG